MFATDLLARISRPGVVFRDPRGPHRAAATVATVSDSIEEIEAADGAAFRRWLEANHDSASAVWLIFWKKDSGRPSIKWPEAVDEALCFGWIDSKVQSMDDDKYRQYFTVRKPGSVWSKINKDKIKVLVAEGRMMPAGQAAIDRAKVDGSWTILDGPEAGIVPDDLAIAMDGAGVRDVYEGLTKGGRKAILSWLVMAKREATRTNRIRKTISALSEGKSPL